MINYALLALSMTSMVFNDGFRNLISKKFTKTSADIYKCNIIVYVVCFLIYFCLAFINGISLFTLGLGVVFGIVTALANMYAMEAYRNGPMNISTLIATSSMIIPALSGWALYGENISTGKFVSIFVLLFFIYFALGKATENKINKTWLVSCALAFVFRGLIGVLQKVHQSSVYKDELFGFLAAAFLCSAIYSVIMSRKSNTKFGKGIYALIIVMGVATFTMNFLNLKLSGILPAELFFPFVNGGTVIINFAVSIFIFKERITKMQLFGFAGGIVSLIAICIL